MNIKPNTSNVLPFSPFRLSEKSAPKNPMYLFFNIYSFGPTSSISKYNRQPKKSTFGTSSRRTYFDIVKREPLVYISIKYLYRIKNNPLYRPI